MFQPFEMPLKLKMLQGFHKRKCQGFTLIEIMVTVAILSFGIVAIFESFFISLDAFSYYSNYIDAQGWINEKIWQLQDQLNKEGLLIAGDDRGFLKIKNRDFDWTTSISLIDEKYGLYKLSVSLFWHEGSRERFIYRMAYAMTQIAQKKDETE